MCSIYVYYIAEFVYYTSKLAEWAQVLKGIVEITYLWNNFCVNFFVLSCKKQVHFFATEYFQPNQVRIIYIQMQSTYFHAFRILVHLNFGGPTIEALLKFEGNQLLNQCSRGT